MNPEGRAGLEAWRDIPTRPGRPEPQPSIGVGEAVMLMDMIDAIYKSAESGKSVAV